MKPSNHRATSGFIKGRYHVAIAVTEHDVCDAQCLRGVCFGLAGNDVDSFDASCDHFLIRHVEDNRLVACFRMMRLAGAEILNSYSAQFYTLDALAEFDGSMAELGRFCIHPNEHDHDIIRVAWAAMTAYVDNNDVKLLFGCTSFAGTETIEYLDAFAMLRDKHLCPKRWMPRVKASDVYKFATNLGEYHDSQTAKRLMPPLLRTYLLMGGWVSDHAVVDHHLNTLHVFTGVEINAIPFARKRLLRAVVG